MELPANTYPEPDSEQDKQAVIDRFEGEWAVLIWVEQQEEPELMVKREQLPAAAQEGDWLLVRYSGNELIHVVADEEATAAAQERIEAKLARLRRGEHLQ